MQVLEKLVEDILNGRNGFRLGDSWKYDRNSAGAVIPIIRDDPPERKYTTLPEENINITDTGDIEGMSVKGVDKPLFIRSGSIFGGDTQNRAAEHSTIVMPEEEKIVKSKCVHASHPVRGGANTVYFDIAPDEVTEELWSGDQHRVWDSVKCFSGAVFSESSAFAEEGGSGHITARVGSSGNRVAADDLTGVKQATKEADSTMRDILKQVPNMENQIGAIIISVDGIDGIEMFDHPESWAKQYMDVISNYESIRKNVKPMFKLDEEAAFDAVYSFLENIKSSGVKTIKEDNRFGVYHIACDNHVGEVTTLDDEVIHLLVFKQKNKGKGGRGNRRPNVADTFIGTARTDNSFMGTGTSDTFSATIDDKLGTLPRSNSQTADDQAGPSNITRGEEMFIKERRGMESLLNTLDEEDTARWKDLMNKLNMSSSTLTRRIQNGQSKGYMTSDYIDGAKKYRLTEKGKQIKKLLEEADRDK